jgi:membrane protein
MKDGKRKKQYGPYSYIRIEKFFSHEIWSVRLDQFPRHKSILYRALRILVLAFRGFSEDKVMLRASALTYFTLMSIVPVLAMGFGIAKGFGMDKYLEEQILLQFQGQEQILSQLIDFSNSLLRRTGGGLIAGVGVGVLFWSVLKVFNHIENAFNGIWQIPKGRAFSRKFSDYLSMMVIAPILMILSSSLNVYISTQLSTLSEKIEVVNVVSPYLMFLLKFMPYLIISALFTMLYIVMPNTKVHPLSALIAGVIAGTVFSLTQWLYIDLQIGVSNYNAIYGSFAALPLFLFWLQISWLILLFGAEISFAHQNEKMYEFETETQNISIHSRKMLSILLLNRIIKQFVAGEPPLTSQEISTDLRLPIRLVRSLLNDLVLCRIVSETITNEPKTHAFQPAQYIDKFTVWYVINALDRQGTSLEPETAEMERILSIHSSFMAKVRDLPENILVKEI